MEQHRAVAFHLFTRPICCNAARILCGSQRSDNFNRVGRHMPTESVEVNRGEVAALDLAQAKAMLDTGRDLEESVFPR